MKKLKFVLALVSLVTTLFSFSSCKKSYTCCKAAYCETVSKGSLTQSAFDAYIKTLRAAGYTCN